MERKENSNGHLSFENISIDQKNELVGETIAEITK